MTETLYQVGPGDLKPVRPHHNGVRAWRCPACGGNLWHLRDEPQDGVVSVKCNTPRCGTVLTRRMLRL